MSLLSLDWGQHPRTTCQSADVRASAGDLGWWTAVSAAACTPTVTSSVAAASGVDCCRRRRGHPRRRVDSRKPPTDMDADRWSLAASASARCRPLTVTETWWLAGRQHSTTPYSLPATTSSAETTRRIQHSAEC